MHKYNLIVIPYYYLREMQKVIKILLNLNHKILLKMLLIYHFNIQFLVYKNNLINFL